MTTNSLISEDVIRIFGRLFSGRMDVYGTHDPQTGRSWQVKAPVTESVIRAHLEGRQPYGVYPLRETRTNLVIVDFDVPDIDLPKTFVGELAKKGVAGYIERSKSKGHHVWCFFADVLAADARAIAFEILRMMNREEVEVFPKQDRLTGGLFGNFVNCPLFGGHVKHGRTVFLDENMRPHADQYAFLKTIRLVPESVLDGVARLEERRETLAPADEMSKNGEMRNTFGLMPCAKKMLESGVTENQRVACFRLAAQLRKTGLPFDSALAVLAAWAVNNRPAHGKTPIALDEIISQTKSAYKYAGYRACGCGDAAVRPFCDPSCGLRQKMIRSS